MKYVLGNFATCPLVAVPVIFVTLLIFFHGHAKGQMVAMNQSHGTASTAENAEGKLDDTKFINGNYTTFLGYTLSGATKSAEILLKDGRGATVKSFSVEATPDGYITIPARFLREGTYSVKLMVDGRLNDETLLRVTW